MVGRHESLRTIFPERLGVPRQEIVRRLRRWFGLRSLRRRRPGLRRRCRRRPAAGLILSRELPLRAHLFALSAREHVLLVVLHHIAGDGWSLGPLSRDLSAFYGARRAGVTAAVAALAGAIRRLHAVAARGAGG